MSDFKDVAAQRFSHSDVVFCLFLITSINMTFDIKSNYFSPVIPKMLKKF